MNPKKQGGNKMLSLILIGAAIFSAIMMIVHIIEANKPGTEKKNIGDLLKERMEDLVGMVEHYPILKNVFVFFTKPALEIECHDTPLYKVVTGITMFFMMPFLLALVVLVSLIVFLNKVSTSIGQAIMTRVNTKQGAVHLTVNDQMMAMLLAVLLLGISLFLLTPANYIILQAALPLIWPLATVPLWHIGSFLLFPNMLIGGIIIAVEYLLVILYMEHRNSNSVLVHPSPKIARFCLMGFATLVLVEVLLVTIRNVIFTLNPLSVLTMGALTAVIIPAGAFSFHAGLKSLIWLFLGIGWVTAKTAEVGCFPPLFLDLVIINILDWVRSISLATADILAMVVGAVMRVFRNEDEEKTSAAETLEVPVLQPVAVEPVTDTSLHPTDEIRSQSVETASQTSTPSVKEELRATEVVAQAGPINAEQSQEEKQEGNGSKAPLNYACILPCWSEVDSTAKGGEIHEELLSLG